MTSSDAAAPAPAADLGRRAATASPPQAPPPANPSDDTSRSQSVGPALTTAVASTVEESANSNQPAFAANHTLEPTEKVSDHQWPTAADPIIHDSTVPPEPTQLSAPVPEPASPTADVAMPSPPTVSPLSTPAATHVHIDENLADEDIDNLVGTTTDAPAMPALRDPSLFRNPVFNPASAIPLNMAASAVDMMELDDPFQPSYPKHDQIQAIATTDPPPNAADFSTGVLSGMQHSQGSIDPNAYVMNLAAQATMFAEAEPDVVDPTAVSLHSFTQEDDALTGSVRPTSASGSQRLESYAQIEFADSTFQMTTYAVIIGRDQQAMEQARIDERREAVWKRKCEENERNGLPPPTPLPDTKLRNKYSKSYVSEEGGMLGPECSDGEGASRPVKKRRPSSVAQSSGGEENGSGDHGQSNRQYVSHTPGAAAVDLGVTQPTSEHIPFIAIHSPGPDIASKTRGISRQHLKIQFNKERGIFEAIALHKNGFFCQDVLYGVDKPATLKSGSLLQIKDVEFRFIINGVQWGMTGAEDEEAGSSKRMSIGGKEMSLDFEHSDHENFNDTSEELSDAENVATPILDESEIGEEAPEPAAAPAAQPVALDEEQALEALRQELGAQTDLDLDLPPEFAMPEIPKRRGPGRPPKDGIMSKRERRLLKKQLQETSKKTLPQNPESEKIKRPVGRPRKNPMPEDGLDSEKRKYNKKRPEGEPGSDTEKRVKEKKDKKVRPKSPPLELRREDYTEEQLQKPSKNYGVLIDEALTNGPPDGLTLKQIYKRIQARYPWFYFMAETKGWESSVRHNLIGNEAFLKDEETSLWSRVPGIELDAGKKRKATSPDRHLGPSHLPAHLTHPSYYQNNPYSTPSSNTYSHPALQAYSTDSKLPQSIFNANGQTAQAHATPSQPIQQATYAAQAPAPAQLPPGYGASALAKPASISQQSTYSSPYARPPPAAKSPVKAETNLPAPRASTATPNVYHAVSTQQYQSKPPVTTAPEGQRFSQTVEDAIKIFCSKMLTTLSQSSPHAAQIIGNSVSRFRGLAVPHPVQGSENTVTTLVDALQNMVKDMQARGTQTTPGPPQPATPAANPSPAPTSSAPQTATPTATLETEIRRRVKNFRESMIKALTTKTDKAETIVDNAINRAQGLPHGAKIAGWEKADDLMVKSVTQIITEARSDFGAKNHTASPAPPAPSREASLSQPVQTTQPAPPPPAQTNIRAEPSASPAPPQTALPRASTTPHIPNYGTTSTPQVPPTQSSASPAMSTAPSSVARPAMSFQRPAPTAVPGLSASPMPRPALPQKSTMPMQTPPAPRPNVSTPAVPSAGVLDQITAQRRFMDNKPSSTTPSQTNIHSGQTSANHVSTAVPGNNLTTGRTGNSTCCL
ncbi:hypothetical protein F5Y16DRAFT_244118 [Xylariaceae sp. FL0255]|nr:hypothetical protein F5Y16DRAFT_244118 [Xylariaceae sp. FL0255]